MRVRMGVHTGEAEVRQDDYVGLDVHRAARICAAGHGGQVLISSSTRELVADELPADVALRDLGEHRLKDLDRPEHLFQLVVGDLPAEFPPLASLSPGSGGANGLPPPPNQTIGRDDDVQAIADRLRVDGVRLLTLTGPGGVGKTRLALEAARAVKADFADGAHFVSLAALQQAARTCPRRSSSAGDRRRSRASLPSRPPSASWPPSTCCWWSTTSSTCWRPRRSSAGCWVPVPRSRSSPPVANRSACRPRSATRWRRSRCPRARRPRTRTRWPACDAVALFCARARARDPGFDLDDANAAAVAEICRRVDGLPLAIELAAARCGLLSPDEIAERLDDALGAMGSGARDAPARQQTLRATIDWSHELLSDAEQQCFARFAVFAGGATVAGRRDDHRRRPRHARRPRRQEPARAPPARPRPDPAGDARNDPRLRRRALRLRRRRARPSASATTATTSRWPSATEPNARCGAPARREHLARLDAEIDNLHAALALGGRAGRAPSRRSRWPPRSAATG